LIILSNLLEKTAVYRIGYRQIFENAGKLSSLRDNSARDGRLALCGLSDVYLRNVITYKRMTVNLMVGLEKKW